MTRRHWGWGNAGDVVGEGAAELAAHLGFGSAELEPANSYTGLRMRVWRGGTIEERNLPQRNHFALEMDHLAACIQNDTEPMTPGEEGLKDMRVIAAIYEAAKTGRTVKLS